jgi:hypothetical protein
VAETKGLKLGLVGVDVAMVVRLPFTRAGVSAWMGVYQRECGAGLLTGSARCLDRGPD